MVGQMTGRAGDLHIGYAIVAQHLFCYLAASKRNVDFGILLETMVEQSTNAPTQQSNGDK